MREQLETSKSTHIEHELLSKTNRSVHIRKLWTLGITAAIFLVMVPALIILRSGFDSNFVFMFGLIIIIWSIWGNRFYSDTNTLLPNNSKHRGIGRMGLGNMNFLGRITGDRKKHANEIIDDRSVNSPSSTFNLFGLFTLTGLFIIILGFVYY
ncbi:MAG: hypothetical protein GPJ54_06195 [Candidatus Heimdallarchaeota archaeon]|nr:hypothetical protein [Candidatus Heimdallarchaeota archaeon]